MGKKEPSADTQVSEDRGGEVIAGTGEKIPLQPVGKTMVRQDIPLQSRHPLQPMGTPCQGQSQGTCPEEAMEQGPGRTCGSMDRGTRAGTGFQAGFVNLWKTSTKANCSCRTEPHRRKDPSWSR